MQILRLRRRMTTEDEAIRSFGVKRLEEHVEGFQVTLLRWSGYVFIVLLLGTAAVMWLGSRLPAEHRAVATAEIAAPEARVWGLIADVAKQPEWRTGLKAVEMQPAGEAGPCWTEVQQAMRMPLCVTASEAPAEGGGAARRVVGIADPKLPFGGDWTYELEPIGSGGSTRVTITERGTTGPAMWRFAGHYVLGEDTQIKTYLRDLKTAAERAG